MGILMFILTTIPNTSNHHLDVARVKKERQICGGLLILFIFMMSCVFSTLDNAVTLLHATGEVNIEAFPRILLALSGLLGGIIFDFKDRRFMSMIMYCVMLLSTICIVVLKYSESLLIGLLIFYMTSRFFVVFFTASFMEYGLQRKNLIEKLSESRMALLIKEEKLLKIKEQYTFTPREIEVFEYLTSTEDSVQDIANNMYVSKRTLERNISAIYKKMALNHG